jgi:CxxC motif-containing protein (DUF1111 family)
MKSLITASLLVPTSLLFASCSLPGGDAASDSSSDTTTDDPNLNVTVSAEASGPHTNPITEAPTGFDAKTNGFNPNNLSAAALQAAMDTAADTFSETEAFTDGIGPVFNNTSCISCHENPRSESGTGSQVTELRAGHFDGAKFVDPPGGSLIHDRANDRSIQQHVPDGFEVQSLRLTLSIAGDGFVEAIDNDTLITLSGNQPLAQRGAIIQIPVVEAGNQLRIGRFGWKDQHASLLSFAGDAYINEMGITNRLFPTENTTTGGLVVQGGPFDGKADPEDDANDIDAFTFFMRSLKAPSRGTITAAVTAGQTSFINAGCAVCHVQTITTAPAGTVVNAGALTVPTALGDKNIHPWGDFLMHDVGTGDGIVQNGGQNTRNMVRTVPLWGAGTRTRFMHDGASLTINNAIQRHANQAATAKTSYNALSATDQANIEAFILSL